MGLALSTPALMAVESTSVAQTQEIVQEDEMEDVWERLSAEQTVALIQKEGTTIGESKTSGNIKITLEKLWADQHTYKILLTVEHLDKTPVDEGERHISFNMHNEIVSKVDYEKDKIIESIPADATLAQAIKIYATVDEFYKKYIKADGSVDEAGYIKDLESGMDTMPSTFSSGSVDNCDVEGKEKYKRYYIITGSKGNLLTEDNVIDLGTYEESTWKEYESKLDLVGYLKEHEKDTLKVVPHEMDERRKAYLEKLKVEDPEAYEEAYKEIMEELERSPKNLLQDNGAKLQVLENVPDYYISDIGFVDAALHIKFRSKGEGIYQPSFIKGEEEVSPEFSSNHSERDKEGDRIRDSYKVYPFKNLAELEGYKLQLRTEEILVQEKGNFVFEVQNKLEKGTIKEMNQKVPLRDKNQGTLKSVTQTRLSLILELENIEKRIDSDNEDLTVVFKDGSKKKLHLAASSMVQDKATFIYDLSEIQKEMAKIMLGDLELVSYK